MKRVVLDTNVPLVSISDRSSLHWIFQHLIDGQYELCITTDILAEYAEIIERHMGSETSNSVLGVIEHLPNVRHITTYFKFQLLRDPDDDKFVDCAIASNASYIVSHDKDFNVLSNISFPKVSVIDVKAFQMDLADEE